MKTTARITLMAATVVGMATPVLAAAATREDTSNYLAWGFLGMCALIVLFQVFPVISLVANLFKGVSSTKDAEMETATSKYR